MNCDKPQILARAFVARRASQIRFIAVFYALSREGVEMIYTQVGNCCSVETVDNTTASTKLTQPEFRSETDLEAAIQAASDRMCAAPDRAGKLKHWREMCRLIDQRTPARQRFMARTQGLA